MSKIIEFSTKAEEVKKNAELEEEKQEKKKWDNIPFIPEEYRTDNYRHIENIQLIIVSEYLADVSCAYTRIEEIVKKNIDNIRFNVDDRWLILNNNNIRYVLKDQCKDNEELQEEINILNNAINLIGPLCDSISLFVATKTNETFGELLSKYNAICKHSRDITNYMSKKHYELKKRYFLNHIAEGLSQMKKTFSEESSEIILDLFGVDHEFDNTFLMPNMHTLEMLMHTGLMESAKRIKEIASKEPVCVYTKIIDLSQLPSPETFKYTSHKKLLENCLNNRFLSNNFLRHINMINDVPLMNNIMAPSPEEEYDDWSLCMANLISLPTSMYRIKIIEDTEKAQLTLNLYCKLVG